MIRYDTIRYDIHLEVEDFSRVTPCIVDAVQIPLLFGCQEELRNTNMADVPANKRGQRQHKYVSKQVRQTMSNFNILHVYFSSSGSCVIFIMVSVYTHAGYCRK